VGEEGYWLIWGSNLGLTGGEWDVCATTTAESTESVVSGKYGVGRSSWGWGSVKTTLFLHHDELISALHGFARVCIASNALVPTHGSPCRLHRASLQAQ